MNKMFADILEYIICMFFPNRCRFCGRVTAPYEDICGDCYKNLPWIKGKVCVHCGTMKADCTCRGRHGHFYESVAAPLYYEGKVKKCIADFKFHDEIKNADCLTDLMIKVCEERFSGVSFDYVTYIPMTEKHEKKRGYNQGQLLAKSISEKTGIPLGNRMLIKIFETEDQHSVREAERRGNVFAAFDFNKEYNIEGKTILLVDDVKTSGTTLSECGKMLYLYGAENVYGLTATIVKGNINKKKKSAEKSGNADTDLTQKTHPVVDKKDEKVKNM